MFPYDVSRRHQARAHLNARASRREIEVEQPTQLFFRNPLAGIRDSDVDGVYVFPSLDANGPSLVLSQRTKCEQSEDGHRDPKGNP